jgi:hypothetical protein
MKLGITADFYAMKHLAVTEMVGAYGERAAMEQTGHTTPTMRIRNVDDTGRQEREG